MKMEKRGKPKRPCISALATLIAMGVMALAGPRPAYANPITFKITERTTLVVPLQVVSGVQLYSPKLGKGFPGLETVLGQYNTLRLSAGAAPILGTSVNVPFVSVSTRLSPRFFDISDNAMYFGVWVGKPSDERHVIAGLSASVALW